MITAHEIRVYWQPGCTSCLRTKEFLTKRGVPFVSRNVIGDDGAFDELARFGVRQVPVVTRGDQYVDGQVLADVARLCGIQYGAKAILPVQELRRRLDEIVAASGRFIAQVPEKDLATLLPNRPRSYSDLAFHVANIPDAFLEHEAGIPLEFDAYNRVPPKGWGHEHLIAYGRNVRKRMSDWFDGEGKIVQLVGAGAGLLWQADHARIPRTHDVACGSAYAAAAMGAGREARHRA